MLPTDERGARVQPGEVYDPYRHRAHVGCKGIAHTGDPACICPACCLDRHFTGANCPAGCCFCPAREQLREASPWRPR